MSASDPWKFQRWAYGVTTGNPVRKAVLSMLATMADSETGRCEAKQATIAEGLETTERTVGGHLRALEASGFIARRPQFRRDRGRRGDEFLLLAPWITEWPDGDRVHPEESSGGPTPPSAHVHSEAGGGAGTTTSNDHAKSRNSGTREDAFPDDLPADLHDVAIAAGKVLKATAIKRGQPKAVTRAAVGQAVMSWPDRDHVQVARDVEYWLLHGNGAGKSCRDVVARFRSFLKSSEPRAAGPMAVAAGENVRPIRPRGGAMTASDLLEAGRRLSGGA